MAVPSHVALQSHKDEKLFLCLSDEAEDRPRGYLQMCGANAYGERSQLELERSESGGGGGLVHVRCLYNNKYWERVEDGWISAAAEQPEEDKTKMSCTLFKPIYSPSNKTLKLQHVQSGCYTCLWTASGPLNVFLYAAKDDEASGDVFTIIDLEQMFIMPRYVAFKGDNHKYLKFVNIGGKIHLQFSAEVVDDYVAIEVHKNPDGTIRIKFLSGYYNFWGLDDDAYWIVANPSNASGIKHTSFSTFKVDDDVVALRELSKFYLLGRIISIQDKKSCLCGAFSYMDAKAKLLVEELVSSRRIYNVKFRIDDARFYNKSDVVIAVDGAVNDTDKPTTLDVKLSYEIKTSSSWKSIASTKLKNVPTTLESCIPRVENGKIQISGYFQEAYQWGVTQEWKTPICSYDDVPFSYAVSVPPMTKASVKVIATTCSFDVPFSYTQRDALFTCTNNIEVEDIDDGKYTGTGFFSIKCVTTKEALQENECHLPH